MRNRGENVINLSLYDTGLINQSIPKIFRWLLDSEHSGIQVALKSLN